LNRFQKFHLLLAITLILTGLALSQPSGDPSPDNGEPSTDMPHRVFGTVEDTQGNTVTDTKIEVVFSGETLESDTTDEDGYYDITVPYGEDYNSEEVQIEVSGSQADSFTYSSGEVEEKDLTAEISGNEEQEGSSGGSSGGGGGFGGGTLPPQDNQDKETVTNSTETGNETVQEQDNSTTEETTDTSDEGGNDGTTNSSEDGTDSTGSENSLTGMFTSSTSSIGEMFTGFFDSILSSVMSLFS
jgi:hypothetical protein